MDKETLKYMGDRVREGNELLINIRKAQEILTLIEEGILRLRMEALQPNYQYQPVNEFTGVPRELIEGAVITTVKNYLEGRVSALEDQFKKL